MAAIQLRPGKRTLYPDTSTLIYAVSGAAVSSDGGDRAVLEALRAVASEANLCLSFSHLMELARGRERAGAAGQVLDTMDIVWLAQPRRAEYLEVRNILLDSVAGTVTAPPIPAVTSFLAQFETLTPGTSPELLRLTSLRAYLQAASEDRDHLQRMDVIASSGKSWSQRFFVDRNAARREGVTAETLQARLDEQLHSQLVDLAVANHDELVAACDPAYAVTQGQVMRFPDKSRLRDIVPLPWDVPHRLPTVFCFHRLIRNAAEVAARKEHVGTKFFQNRDGDLFDWSHVVGAAYADAFCCDQRTAENLGDARIRLERNAPLTLKNGDKKRLADEIRAAVLL